MGFCTRWNLLLPLHRFAGLFETYNNGLVFVVTHNITVRQIEIIECELSRSPIRL